MERAAIEKGFFAGRIAPVGALLLLFVLPAPPGVSPGPADAPGNRSARGGMAGDNPAGIYRGAQPERERFAAQKAMGIRTVINLRTRHGEREAVEAEMEAFGFHEAWFQLKKFVRRYREVR